MALCRCLENHPWPRGKKRKYVAYVILIGYPKSSLICGLCDNLGVIWIEDFEVKVYKSGERIFVGQTNVVKMKADGSGINK